jgi:outer membrane protein assembly factor BamB
MRALIPLAIVLALAACSGDSAKKENIEPPTPLSEFESKASVERLWSANLGDGAGRTGARLSPAFAGGRVFAAGLDSGLVAFDASNGKRLWGADLEGLTGGPAAAITLVVVGSIEGEVYAFDPESGEPRWQTRVSSEVVSAPAIDDNLVVVVANDGRVHGLDARDGKQLWAVDRGVPTLSLRGNSVPIISGGQVIVASANGKITALARNDGRMIWEQSVGVAEGRTDLERMIDVDGRIAVQRGDVFLAGYNSAAQALTSDGGRTLWTRDLSSVAGLAVGDDAVFVSATNGEFWALDRRTGSSLWKIDVLAHRMLSAPALIGDYVVVGDLEGYLHVIERASGDMAARVQLGDAGFGDGLIVADGVLYAQNADGALGAFRVN